MQRASAKKTMSCCLHRSLRYAILALPLSVLSSEVSVVCRVCREGEEEVGRRERRGAESSVLSVGVSLLVELEWDLKRASTRPAVFQKAIESG